MFLIEQIKESFKIVVISLTSVLVILFVLLLILSLHIFKFARKIYRRELLTKA